MLKAVAVVETVELDWFEPAEGDEERPGDVVDVVELANKAAATEVWLCVTCVDEIGTLDTVVEVEVNEEAVWLLVVVLVLISCTSVGGGLNVPFPSEVLDVVPAVVVGLTPSFPTPGSDPLNVAKSILSLNNWRG